MKAARGKNTSLTPTFFDENYPRIQLTFGILLSRIKARLQGKKPGIII